MIWRIKLCLAFLLIFSCKQEKDIQTPSIESKQEESSQTYLIEVEELKSIINNPEIKVVDFRKVKDYNQEHIVGALNIWRTDIENPSYDYKGMMASKEQIESLFSGLGISNEDTLILYDENGLCDSARLWWLLQNYDFTNVRLLHGGLSEWKLKNGKTSKDKPEITETSFVLTDNPSMKFYVSKEEMLDAIDKKVIILDTRTDDEFTGKRQKKGALKGGRIPNSKLIDWAHTIDYHHDKKMKSIEDLEKIYNKLIPSKNDTVIVYCHSGVRSAHTTFVLTQMLDYKNVKNYDGSWTEWSQYDHLPIERDSTTTIFK